MASDPRRAANRGLWIALVSYACGIIALFPPGVEDLSRTSDQLLEWGVVLTAVLNTVAITQGASARKHAGESDPSTRRKAGWAVALGLIGYLGTAVLALAIFGSALAQVGR